MVWVPEHENKIYLAKDEIRFNIVVAKGKKEELYVTVMHPREFEGKSTSSTLETVVVKIPPEAKHPRFLLVQKI